MRCSHGIRFMDPCAFRFLIFLITYVGIKPMINCPFNLGLPIEVKLFFTRSCYGQEKNKFKRMGHRNCERETEFSAKNMKTRQQTQSVRRDLDTGATRVLYIHSVTFLFISLNITTSLGSHILLRLSTQVAFSHRQNNLPLTVFIWTWKREGVTLMDEKYTTTLLVQDRCISLAHERNQISKKKGIEVLYC